MCTFWRYSVSWESVKHTHSHAHKKVHIALMSQRHAVALGAEAEQFPVRWGLVWFKVSSWVRRCQDTCSNPVSLSSPSNLPCTQSLSLQWSSSVSGETTAAGILHILYLQEKAQMLLNCCHLIALLMEKPHLQAIHRAINSPQYICYEKQSIAAHCIWESLRQ